MSVFISFIIIPHSLFIQVMSIISFVSTANLGLSEIRGKHVRYSKFLDVTSSAATGTEIKVPSKIGMLISYTPALAASTASLFILVDSGSRYLLLISVLILHFFKRVLEVLFIHRYSGAMMVDIVIQISLAYFLTAVTMIYAQHVAEKEIVEPDINLKYYGIALFLVGITGNFYHHYLLSRLRKNDDKRYKIPKGGLFGLVVCPHYLFEVVEFVGVAFISQTVYAFSFTLGSMTYLMGRSYATRKWYLSKFPNFPKDVRAIIPYVF